MSNRYYSRRLKEVALKIAKQRRPRSRPKSFKTEQAAKKWAETNKITSYTLRNLKSPENKKKKIIIIAK